MFLEKTHDSPIKIIDLGNIVELDTSDGIFRDNYLVGTPGYLAPETISNKLYSKRTDIWQAGCTLYSLLSGLPPFDPNNYKQVTDFSYYPMTGPAWDDISASAKSLVTKMLKKNANHRISVSDILEHSWLVDEAPDTDFNPDYFTRIKHLALRTKMKAFFLESSLMEGHKKRKHSLREALPIFKHASDAALLSPEIDEVEEDIRTEVEEFNSKMKVLKNMVVNSISGDVTGDRKEIDYNHFIEMLKACHLQELCSLQVFNIFDIGNTGTIDPREFLLTMLAFRTDKPKLNSPRRRTASRGEEGENVTVLNIEVSPDPMTTVENEDEIRLFFNVFDIKETGYIELDELKIAVNFLLYMGSDQPQTLPNIHELFSIIDVAQTGRIDYSEFKQFYRHIIASNLSMNNNQ
jgi:serine/threonine protein kinase